MARNKTTEKTDRPPPNIVSLRQVETKPIPVTDPKMKAALASVEEALVQAHFQMGVIGVHLSEVQESQEECFAKIKKLEAQKIALIDRAGVQCRVKKDGTWSFDGQRQVFVKAT